MEVAPRQVYGQKYNLHMELVLEQTKEWAVGFLPALWDAYNVWFINSRYKYTVNPQQCV